MSYTPFANPETGLEHHEMPKIKRVDQPKAMLYVGNSFFFFNNGAHRYANKMLKAFANPPKCRGFSVTINGSSLSWHDVESYFRPHAIASYSINDRNEVVFRDPNEQLWDTVLLCDCSQGPIHPVLGLDFIEFAKKDSEICRRHDANPVFVITWAYADKPEMTAQLADATIKVANDNDALVIPGGLAFALAKQKDPTVELIIGDKRHPTPAGSYLLAATIVSSLFEDFNVEDLTLNMDIEPKLAKFLRQVARETTCRFFGR